MRSLYKGNVTNHRYFTDDTFSEKYLSFLLEFIDKSSWFRDLMVKRLL